MQYCQNVFQPDSARFCPDKSFTILPVILLLQNHSCFHYGFERCQSTKELSSVEINREYVGYYMVEDWVSRRLSEYVRTGVVTQWNQRQAERNDKSSKTKLLLLERSVRFDLTDTIQR